MKKSFWGPKTHFLFFDFYHKISYGENDFVIQIIYIFCNCTLYVSDQIATVATPWCIFELNFFHKTFLTLLHRSFKSVPRQICGKSANGYTPIVRLRCTIQHECCEDLSRTIDWENEDNVKKSVFD